MTKNGLTSVVCGLVSALSACATSVAPIENSVISRAEAKAHACPPHILAAGATAQDCECAASKLYELGQDKALLTSQKSSVHDAFENETSARGVAIGLIRLEAFEMCGFFKPGHVVNENLGSSE